MARCACLIALTGCTVAFPYEDFPPDPAGPSLCERYAAGRASCPGSLRDCDGDGACETDVATDPAHCGYCGHACDGCADAQCTSVELATGDFRRVAVAGADLFAIDQANIVRFAGGGGVGEPFVLGVGLIDWIASDGELLYWMGFNSDWRVWATPLAGGGAATSLAVIDDYPGAFAVVPGRAFWADDGAIMTVSKAGGDAAPVAVDQGEVSSLAADAEHLYFAASGSVRRLPLALTAPQPEVLVPDAGAIGVAVDGEALYWVTAGEVVRAEKSGAAPVALVSGSERTGVIAASGGEVFFGTNPGVQGTSLIWALALCPDQEVRLVSGALSTGVAFSASDVYLASVGGALVRTAR